MPEKADGSNASLEWLTGGVCGLLLVSGLAIGDYVRSRTKVAARPIERTVELCIDLQDKPAQVQSATWNSTAWPDDLPEPRELPRPLNLDRFVDDEQVIDAPEERVVELPDSGTIQR